MQETTSLTSTHTYKITNIQTTHPKSNKCNGQWYMHSHRIYTFPAHDWQGRKGIFTASSKYLHTFLLWATQNLQATLSSLSYCFWVWWSNWPSLCLHHSFYFIDSLANNFPSYVKDTKHFVHLIEKLQPLQTNALLVTVDVTFLYKKIAHKEGIVAVIHFMKEYKHLLPTNRLPHNKVCIILGFILKKATSNSWTSIYTESLVPLWETGWLPPMPIYSWARKNAP